MEAKLTGAIHRSYESKTKEDSMKYFEDWAEKYDEDVEAEKYQGPAMLAKLVAEHVPDRSTAILDVGAGTGAVGRELAKLGFTTVDGVDGSEQMLAVAARCGGYRRLFQEVFQEDAPPMNVPIAQYEVVVASGIFGPGHLNFRHMETLIAPAKKGGLIMFVINRRWVSGPLADFPEWDGNGVERRLEELATEGRCCLLHRLHNEYVTGDLNAGVGFVLRVP